MLLLLAHLIGVAPAADSAADHLTITPNPSEKILRIPEIAPSGQMPVYKPGTPWPWCPTNAAQSVARQIDDGHGPNLRKLTELPPGDMYVAVFRHDENGCNAPIVVKYGVGRR